MASVTARQVWRRQKASATRRERTVVEYIRVKYPEIYSESLNVYNVLNSKYPNKFDIRKLPEFYETCHASSSNKYPNKVQSDSNKFRDSMVLRIPLLQNSTTSTPQASGDLQDTTTSTPQASGDLQDTTTSTPQASGDLQDTTTSTPQASGDLQDQPHTPTGSEVPEAAQYVQLGQLEHDVVDMIIEELEQEPDLYNFFEDIDVEQLSPLEEELLMY